MKKSNFFSKTMVTLVAVSMSVFLFAGCQSKSNDNNTAQAANNTTQNSKKPDPAQMKQRMQDNLKALVTAGTITQAQSDKILEALTTNTGKKDDQGKSQNNTQNNNQNNQQGNNQNRQRTNPLSKLVSDGTITQAQADAVMQKVRGNFNRKNNGQGSQSNGQTSTN
ncbi:hypothetical protein I6U48_11665 [Clostridium sp. PL3]|uniref:Lipoprotein n=1 Tax=Clostridium thailandense TaxID=2794346 RepID=A0A949TQJ2_9CLOT|nr:hypothetical protein [Clostridium thailandense]MBV7273567.1 hypothetical protein [Clostridium thailandense]